MSTELSMQDLGRAGKVSRKIRWISIGVNRYKHPLLFSHFYMCGDNIQDKKGREPAFAKLKHVLFESLDKKIYRKWIPFAAVPVNASLDIDCRYV